MSCQEHGNSIPCVDCTYPSTQALSDFNEVNHLELTELERSILDKHIAQIHAQMLFKNDNDPLTKTEATLFAKYIKDELNKLNGNV